MTEADEQPSEPAVMAPLDNVELAAIRASASAARSTDPPIGSLVLRLLAEHASLDADNRRMAAELQAAADREAALVAALERLCDEIYEDAEWRDIYRARDAAREALAAHRSGVPGGELPIGQRVRVARDDGRQAFLGLLGTIDSEPAGTVYAVQLDSGSRIPFHGHELEPVAEPPATSAEGALTAPSGATECAHDWVSSGPASSCTKCRSVWRAGVTTPSGGDDATEAAVERLQRNGLIGAPPSSGDGELRARAIEWARHPQFDKVTRTVYAGYRLTTEPASVGWRYDIYDGENRRVARNFVADERDAQQQAESVARALLSRLDAPSGDAAADFDAAPPRATPDMRDAATWSTCRGVVGCRSCGKPQALVGDAIHPDGLCPWCRATHLPHVTRAWLDDEGAPSGDAAYRAPTEKQWVDQQLENPVVAKAYGEALAEDQIAAYREKVERLCRAVSSYFAGLQLEEDEQESVLEGLYKEMRAARRALLADHPEADAVADEPEPCCGEWGTGSGMHGDECPEADAAGGSDV